MLEFGSDFHCIEKTHVSERTILYKLFPQAFYVANGRMCLFALLLQYQWKRIWMPEYFCHDVINSIRKYGVEVKLYKDYPGFNDTHIVDDINFQKGDVLLRMNFFGMRDFRSENSIPVPVIEDHTHDLLGNWALNSNADWCIASLRKTFPIAQGGMFWSPKGHKMTVHIESLDKNEINARERWEAMEIKSLYLQGNTINKEDFRTKYIHTEYVMDNMSTVGSMDVRSKDYINNIDPYLWYESKKNNLALLKSLVSLPTICSENPANNLFSFVVLFSNQKERDEIRRALVEKMVYTAILWNVPDEVSHEVKSFSKRILSIHCDGRYSESDIIELSNRINSVL